MSISIPSDCRTNKCSVAGRALTRPPRKFDHQVEYFGQNGFEMDLRLQKSFDSTDIVEMYNKKFTTNRKKSEEIHSGSPSAPPRMSSLHFPQDVGRGGR